MFKVNDVVKTRDGRIARIICTDRIDDDDKDTLIALVEKGSYEVIREYQSDGRYCRESEHANDLIKPAKLYWRRSWARTPEEGIRDNLMWFGTKEAWEDFYHLEFNEVGPWESRTFEGME